MKNKKYGFTMSEILVCITVIGVIMAISVQSLRLVRASYTSLTYFAFNNIKAAVGEIFSGDLPGEKLKDENGQSLPSPVVFCRNNNGMLTSVLKGDKTPNSLVSCKDVGNSGEETNVFCKSMVSMMNTSGKIDCTNLHTAQVTNGTPYIDEGSIDVNSPNFVTTNGQRYYLTSWAYNSSISDDYGFRLIAVDLNGKSKPNTMTASSHKTPSDIVTFLIMDNGEVYPLGIAADNIELTGGKTIQYLNAKVKGYYYSYDTTRTDGIPQECTMKTKSGNVKSCNYAVVYLENNKVTDTNKAKSFFSYRQGYCNSLGGNSSTFKTYCIDTDGSRIDGNFLCPPSNNEKQFDLCLVENIKPAFRYNFR